SWKTTEYREYFQSFHWLCSWLWFLFLRWSQCCCDSHIAHSHQLMLKL
ncbi:unnamed protein product, partial [Brassica rapa subsp. trilocularis]